MKITELKIVSAKDLNESLAKTFGTKLRLDDFTNEQLEDARNRLRTQLSAVETNESFDTVHTSDAYQKGRMFLDVINQEIAERSKAKPDFIDADKDGDKKEPMKKAIKDKEAKEEVKEGAEEEATLVMAAKDMVDRITGWMEDTAEMQTESMLELGDKIRDELGSEKSEEFINTVKPALENLYTVFETTREAMTGGVAIVTGEGAPATMGTDPEAPAEDPVADMEPTVDADAGAEQEPVADEFGASEPATGGEEVADREKRESVQRSRRLGQMLTDSKKKTNETSKKKTSVK
jgi:hypothetical protein|tara:strand:- start:2594 stop:3469 length:876 start_codon:yes stop_codon:yes gene_type:complete